MKLAGHCVRHPEEEASKLVIWQPTIGQASIGRRAVTYIDTLMRHKLGKCIITENSDDGQGGLEKMC